MRHVHRVGDDHQPLDGEAGRLPVLQGLGAVRGVSAALVKRLPRRARSVVLRAAQVAAGVSLLLWLALGLPLLSAVGAATLTHFMVLALPVLAWRGLGRAVRKAGRSTRRR